MPQRAVQCPSLSRPSSAAAPDESRREDSSTDTAVLPAATRGRIRQSLLYSARPRRSRRPTSDKLPVEEHAGEVSSREFEALTLDQSRPTPETTHRQAGTATHVRQSVLYSGRLRRSRDRREQEPSPNELMVEKNASKVSSGGGPTVTDLPELTDRVEKNAGKVSDIEGPAVKAPPVKEDAIEMRSREFKAPTPAQSLPTCNPTQRSRKRDYYAADSKGRSEIFEEMLKGVSEPWAQTCCDMRKYLEEHTYTCMVEAMIAAEHGFSNPAQHKLDAEAFLASKGAFKAPEAPESFAFTRENIAQAEVSTEEIIENGKKWMGEEVMLAFKKYSLRKLI